MTEAQALQAGPMLLRVGEVAEALGVHSRTVWRLAAAGDIPAPIRVGPRLVRWKRAELEAFLATAPRVGGAT